MSSLSNRVLYEFPAGCYTGCILVPNGDGFDTITDGELLGDYTLPTDGFADVDENWQVLRFARTARRMQNPVPAWSSSLVHRFVQSLGLG